MFGLRFNFEFFVNMWKIPGPGITWLSFAAESGIKYFNMHFCILGFQLFDITIIRKAPTTSYKV